MSSELTNLLPHPQIALFRRAYFLRVTTLAIVILALTIVISGVLLVPTYFFLNQEVNAKNNELQRLTTSLQTTQEKDVQTRLTNLQSEASYLQQLDGQPTASGALRAVLAVSRPGISISGFTYTPPTTKAPGNMQIVGTASTRETLRAYDQALAALPFVTSANLPISDYAAESDISFTITLTGSFKS